MANFEVPARWIMRRIAGNFVINSDAYRVVDSYDKLYEAEVIFGDEFNFSAKQLSRVELPPIPEEEFSHIYTIFLDYKKRVIDYWTMRGIIFF